MKTHILRTQDGLEYRLTSQEATAAAKALDNNASVTIEGNRITNADHPQIRKVPQAHPSVLQLADATFNQKSPRWYYLNAWMTEGISDFRKEGKIIHIALLDYVGEQVDWDFEESKKFLRKDWGALQEYNQKTNLNLETVRPDHNRNAIFEPSNLSGKRCGKCMNGWLPGDDGLIPCTCNSRYA